MDYKARFYDPYINRFIQPDTIVPDPANPQSWNRYAYVRNSPINFNDPSGHSRDCGIGDTYCTAGEYTPASLLRLYRDNKTTKGLSEDIDNYLTDHPDYDPMKDNWKGLRSHRLIFNEIRESYWEDRLYDANICGGLNTVYCPTEATNLMRYYDYNEEVMLPAFDASKVSWNNVISDVIGMPLGMLGPNPQHLSNGAKNLLQGISFGNSAYSLATGQDSTDRWLAIGGSIPGVGVITSAVSFGRHMSVGRYEYEYSPSLPR